MDVNVPDEIEDFGIKKLLCSISRQEMSNN